MPLTEGKVPPSGKILMLAGSLPGTGHVGEIILRDLVKHRGIGQFHCVGIVSPRYAWKPDPQLAMLSADLVTSTHGNATRWGEGRWSALGSLVTYKLGFNREVARLVDLILPKARAAGVGQVFAVLNNPLMMAVGRRVAATLGLPLTSLVWDPPEYLLRQARFDRWSRKALLAEFKASLASSAQVAVVSETMRQDYAAFTSAPIHILRHGLPMDFGPEADPASGPSTDEWQIGFAGSMYSDCAWRALLKALDHAGWMVAGRPVRIKLLTGRIVLASKSPARIDFMGFRSPEEVQTVLANCHLTYMPQPFISQLSELCRYSFPTKLTNYLALGRPVFVHAPPEGALSTFFDAHPIGARATSRDAAPIIEALESILGDPAAYQQACRQVRKTAQEHFDVSVFHAAIDGLFGKPA